LWTDYVVEDILCSLCVSFIVCVLDQHYLGCLLVFCSLSNQHCSKFYFNSHLLKNILLVTRRAFDHVGHQNLIGGHC